MGAAKLVVADGLENWLTIAQQKLFHRFYGAKSLVVVFQDETGRIGFDLSKQGENLFSKIIGEAYSWSPKNECPVQYESGLPTSYVRTLFLSGLSLPITLALRPIFASPNGLTEEIASLTPRGLDRIPALTKFDLDVECEELAFSEGVTLLASESDRVCVHSTAQWETIVVATDGEFFINQLSGLCSCLNVEFSYVQNERLLPKW